MTALRSAWKTQTSHRRSRSCFLSSFVKFCSVVSKEKSKMSQPIRGQGGHLFFSNRPELHQLDIGYCDLASCQVFRWIPFNSFRGEFENVSANQMPGRPSCFSYRPEKHNLCRGRWDLASCQVSLNFVQQFQRRGRKCLKESETRAAILFFQSSKKT